MKKFYMILVVFFLVLPLDAQMINLWKPVYEEVGSFLDFNRNSNFSTYNSDNMLLIDQEFANTRPMLVRTGNGGVTWDTLFRTKSFQYEINSVFLINNDKMIWVGDSLEYQGNDGGYNTYYRRSGVFAVSANGGKDWAVSKLDSNTLLDYVVFVNDSCGLISQSRVGNKYNVDMIFRDTLLFSTDLFKTYRKIAVPENYSYVDYIHMFSESHFIVRVLNSKESRYFYYETTDQGLTWTEFMKADKVNDIDFVSRDIIYKIESTRNHLNQYSSIIYKTTNGGATWVDIFAPKHHRWSNYYMISIDAADENNVIVVGSNSSIYRSRDGGNNWSKEFAPNIDGGLAMEYDAIYDVVFPDVETAYIATGGYLFKTAGEMALQRPVFVEIGNGVRVNPKDLKVSVHPVEGATRYRIKLATDNSNVFDFETLEHPMFDTTITDTAVIVPNLEYDRCYYAAAKAINDDSESEWTIRASLFCTMKSTNFVEPPIFVKPQAGELVKSNIVDIVWTKVAEAEEYELSIGYDPYIESFSYSNLKDTLVAGIELMYDMLYSVRVRVSKGEKISDWRYLSFKIYDPTGIEDLVETSDYDVSFYPNPANDYLNIIINSKNEINESDLPVRIFNSFGETVLESIISTTTESHRISLDALASGTYFLQCGNSVKKFIVVK